MLEQKNTYTYTYIYIYVTGFGVRAPPWITQNFWNFKDSDLTPAMSGVPQQSETHMISRVRHLILSSQLTVLYICRFLHVKELAAGAAGFRVRGTPSRPWITSLCPSGKQRFPSETPGFRRFPCAVATGNPDGRK